DRHGIDTGYYVFDRRHPRRPALLGRRARDFPPPVGRLRPLAFVPADDRALAYDGDDAPHADLDRLLHDGVHLVALGNALDESDCRCRWLHVAHVTHLGPHLATDMAHDGVHHPAG